MQTAIWVFVWLLTAYLVGNLAYVRGRRDKWEELSKDYICIHKSVSVKPADRKNKIKKTNKRLDKKRLKRYNKSSYKYN